MTQADLASTTIGKDYLNQGQAPYPVDTLLDYLSGLQKLKAEQTSEIWLTKFNNEIAALKYILTVQTT